jgi:hypothetical protein
MLSTYLVTVRVEIPSLLAISHFGTTSDWLGASKQIHSQTREEAPKGTTQTAGQESFLRVRPQRYKCPHCKWDFANRKKRCCPDCGTLLLIASDTLSDAELTALKSFWMWEPFKEKWDYISDWEEHKCEAMQKFEEYIKGKGGGIKAEDKPRPLTHRIQ